MNHLDLASAFKALSPTDQVRVLNSIGAQREKPERFLVTLRFTVWTHTGPGSIHDHIETFKTVVMDRSPVEFMADPELQCRWFPDCVLGTITIVNVHPFHGREHIEEGRL